MREPVISTARLLFYEWTREDRDSIARICADPEVVRWLNFGNPFEEQVFDRFLDRRISDQERFGWSRWALELREPAHGDPTGIVGFCGFGSQIAPEPELGWTLLTPLTGRGLATEAARAALDFGFEVAQMPSVISAILPENVRSRAVAERLGMRLDGTLLHDGVEHLRYLAENHHSG